MKKTYDQDTTVICQDESCNNELCQCQGICHCQLEISFKGKHNDCYTCCCDTIDFSEIEQDLSEE